jgi:hypothetical protein
VDLIELGRLKADIASQASTAKILELDLVVWRVISRLVTAVAAGPSQ